MVLRVLVVAALAAVVAEAMLAADAPPTVATVVVNPLLVTSPERLAGAPNTPLFTVTIPVPDGAGPAGPVAPVAPVAPIIVVITVE